MDRIEERDDEIVELGVASIETKGPPVNIKEALGGHTMTGISDVD